MWKATVVSFVITVLVAVVLTGIIMSVGSRFHRKFMDDDFWFIVCGIVVMGLIMARITGYLPVYW